MLLSLKINNFQIYNKEVEFSMRTDLRCKKFPQNVLKEKALKSVVVFGGNNAGKTNLVGSLQVIKNMMLGNPVSMLSNFYTTTPIVEMQVNFLESDEEYLFAVKYDAGTEEFIYEKYGKVCYDVYKNTKEDILLLRNTVDEIYKCKEKEIETLLPLISKNNLFIHQVDTKKFQLLKEIKDVVTGFATKIEIINMNDIPITKTMELMKKSSVQQKKVAHFLKNADLYLEDFKYLAEEELKIDDKIYTQEIQEKVFETKANIIDLLHLHSVYQGISVPSIMFDSTGTKKMTCLAGYIIEALEEGKILVVDELDNSLHFKLVRTIIAMFNNEKNVKSQLIATVHDINLMDCQKLFRKEQIWFVHKAMVGIALYSFAEFTSAEDGVRDTNNLIKKYKQGCFGAVPEPNILEMLRWRDSYVDNIVK